MWRYLTFKVSGTIRRNIKKVKNQGISLGRSWLESEEEVFEAIASLDYLFKVAIFENPTNQVKMMEIVFQHLITEKNIRSIFIDGKNQNGTNKI